jgi:hypothetical protein
MLDAADAASFWSDVDACLRGSAQRETLSGSLPPGAAALLSPAGFLRLHSFASALLRLAPAVESPSPHGAAASALLLRLASSAAAPAAEGVAPELAWRGASAQ